MIPKTTSDVEILCLSCGRILGHVEPADEFRLAGVCPQCRFWKALPIFVAVIAGAIGLGVVAYLCGPI